MKLRKTLSTLLAAALMCGLLCVPSMAAVPSRITGGDYYNTIELSDAVNEGTARLDFYHSDGMLANARVYTVQAGTTLRVTGDHYITVHPVTLMPDGSYQFKSMVYLDGYGRVTTDPTTAINASNDPQYSEQSVDWRSWTWYIAPPNTINGQLRPEYQHLLAEVDTVVTSRYSSVVLNNSHAGTWLLKGSNVILKVLPVQVADQGNTISVYQVTSKSGLNVRSGAGTNYSKVGFMTNGTQFEVVTSSVNNGWGQLTNGNWVWLGGARFIQYKGSCGVVGRQQATWTAANTYRVVTGSLAIHDGPASSHAVVGSVPQGSLISVTEYYGEDWGYLASGAGWVNLGANGNIANVQFAEIKYATNVNRGANLVNSLEAQAHLVVNAADGIVPIRASASTNSVVIGYLFNQADGSYVDLIDVNNDWGLVASPSGQGQGWVYLPTAGLVTAGIPLDTVNVPNLPNA